MVLPNVGNKDDNNPCYGGKNFVQNNPRLYRNIVAIWGGILFLLLIMLSQESKVTIGHYDGDSSSSGSARIDKSSSSLSSESNGGGGGGSSSRRSRSRGSRRRDNYANPISKRKLQELIDKLRNDDTRIFRWDATKHTRKVQNQGGCKDFSRALDVIIAAAEKHPKDSDQSDELFTNEHVSLAGEYVTFCVTDNPQIRAAFGRKDGIHSAVIQLVKSSDPIVSSRMGNIIYIASFSNNRNHQSFINLGAVSVLGSIIKSPSSSLNVQIMWAAAALQNLAASYCDTEDDGRCYWRFDPMASHKEQPKLIIRKTSLPMISDGSVARQQIANDVELMQKLVLLSCRGPVQGNESPTNPFPGSSAIVGGRDNRSPNIVPWSTVSVLKNVALSSSPQLMKMIEPAMICVCKMAKTSQDWLERNKANAVIRHSRKRDPCWFGPDGDDHNNPDAKICVDRFYVDMHGYDCSGYERAKPSECFAPDVTGISPAAKEACCGPCGGGYRGTNREQQQQ